MKKYFFYIVQHKITKKYYIGSKYGQDADINTFMTENGYKTSSSTISKIIELEGLDIFDIIKIKLFETPSEAYNYETRFLKKVDAKNNKKFYNSHNNDILGYGSDGFYFVMEQKYGVKHALQSNDICEKSKQTCLKNYGVEWYFQSEEFKSNYANYASMGGKIQGQRNAESGHMQEIQKLSPSSENGKKSVEIHRKNKTGCFFNKELHKISASMGGKVQGKINAETGHLKNISVEYWQKVKSGEVIREKKHWCNDGNIELQLNITEPMPDSFKKGRLKKDKNTEQQL